MVQLKIEDDEMKNIIKDMIADEVKTMSREAITKEINEILNTKISSIITPNFITTIVKDILNRGITTHDGSGKYYRVIDMLVRDAVKSELDEIKISNSELIKTEIGKMVVDINNHIAKVDKEVKYQLEKRNLNEIIIDTITKLFESKFGGK